MSFIGNLGKAAGLLLQTWPFIALRLGVLVAVGLISFVLFVLLLGGMVLLGFGNLLGLGLILGILLLLVFFGIFGWLKHYFLYLYDAGHVAVMSKIIKGEGKDIPGAFKQLDYGKEVVLKRFGSLTVLYVFEQLVRGVVSMINRGISFFMSFMPKSVQNVLGFVVRVLNRAIFLIFDMTLSHLVFAPSKNAWMCAADTLVIYKKNMWRFVGVAAALVIFADLVSLFFFFLGYIVVFAAIGVAVATGGGFLGISLAVLSLVFMFIFIGAVRECILVPYSRALILCEFYDAFSQVKTITKEDYGLLNSIPQFQELLQKAKEKPTPETKAKG